MGLYTNLSVALERAMAKAAAPQEAHQDILELLQMSAGRWRSDGETIEYRPFWAAAQWLSQSRREQVIKQDGQTQFTGMAVPIASMLEIQAALDRELIVPLGFEAQSGAAQKASAAQLQQYKEACEVALLTLRKYIPRP